MNNYNRDLLNYDFDPDAKIAMCRKPDHSELTVATGPVADAINAMLQLSDMERETVMSLFCKACGSLDPGCYCQHDE